MQIAGLCPRPNEWFSVGMGCGNLILKAQESWKSITPEDAGFLSLRKEPNLTTFFVSQSHRQPNTNQTPLPSSPLVWILPSHQVQCKFQLFWKPSWVSGLILFLLTALSTWTTQREQRCAPSFLFLQVDCEALSSCQRAQCICNSFLTLKWLK